MPPGSKDPIRCAEVPLARRKRTRVGLFGLKWSAGGIHKVVDGEGPGRRSTKRRTDAWPVLLGQSRTCWRPMCGWLGEPPPERDHKPSHALKWYKMMRAAELLPETPRDVRGGCRDE